MCTVAEAIRTRAARGVRATRINLRLRDDLREAVRLLAFRRRASEADVVEEALLAHEEIRRIAAEIAAQGT